MNHKSSPSEREEAPLLIAGIKGLCPKCGASTLFAAPVHFAERCRACGQDFSAYNGNGRPFALLALLVAGLVFGLAMLVEEVIYPPLWVQVTVWPIVTVVAVIAFLRMTKGARMISAWRQAQAKRQDTADDDR